MFSVLCVCALLSAATDVVQGKSHTYQEKIGGWITVQKVVTTWAEASQQCEDEGAVLMSPIRKELFEEMWSLMVPSVSYFIGTKAMFHPRVFTSVEGILLDDMPVTHMYDQLDSRDGKCLSMDRSRIQVVSCDSRLPYMCYREHKQDQVQTICGTYDEGYKFNEYTGSCYKFHAKDTSWTDAYLKCIAEGGYLAILNDAHEVLEIQPYLTDPRHWYVSVGLYDWKGKGDWRSIHGTPINKLYSQWFNGTQPRNSCCDTGSIHPSTKSLRAYAADLTSPFICEKDPNYVKFAPHSEPEDASDSPSPIY